MSRDTFPDLLREDPTAEVVDLSQHLIRNRRVNDGSADSGNEARSADLITRYLGTNSVDLEVVKGLARHVAVRPIDVLTCGDAAVRQLQSGDRGPYPDGALVPYLTVGCHRRPSLPAGGPDR